MKDIPKAKTSEAKHKRLPVLSNGMSFNSTPEAQMDYEVRGGGSVFIVVPLNDEATKNLEDKVGEETMWFAGGIAVEHGYIAGLVEQLRNEGRSVR